MGKLHTLRRAIERDPHQWYHEAGGGWLFVKDAHFIHGVWRPGYPGGRSYRDFVRSVLIDLEISEPKANR